MEAFNASQLFCLLFFLFSVGLYCLGFLVEGTFFGEEEEEVGVESYYKKKSTLDGTRMKVEKMKP